MRLGASGTKEMSVMRLLYQGHFLVPAEEMRLLSAVVFRKTLSQWP
jgi:hypothetical protein